MGHGAATSSLGKNVNLEGERVVGLRAGQVDGRLPAFVLVPGVEFDVGAEALDDVDGELVLRGAAGDEVLRRSSCSGSASCTHSLPER